MVAYNDDDNGASERAHVVAYPRYDDVFSPTPAYGGGCGGGGGVGARVAVLAASRGGGGAAEAAMAAYDGDVPVAKAAYDDDLAAVTWSGGGDPEEI